jgi:hypothetical protein
LAALGWLWRNIVGPLLPSGVVSFFGYHLGYLSLLAAVVCLFVLYVGTLAGGRPLAERLRKRLSSTPSLPEPTARQPLDEDLIQRCCELSAEIFEFLRHQEEDFDKRLKSDHRYVFLEGSYRSQWRAEEAEEYEERIVRKYSEELGGAVSDLCDDLEAYGWCPSRDRNKFETPAGSQDIRYTAQRLEAICRRFGRS